METQYSSTGVMLVNGAWVTRVRYEADVREGQAVELHVRFMQGSVEVERAVINREQALLMLGERNLAAIDKHVGQRKPEENRVKGELDGPRLAYREVVLPETSAAIEAPASEASNAIKESSKGRRRQAERDPHAVPARVAAKFLREGDKYYFADRSLAFVDGGNQLSAATENRSVISDLVAIAKARQWAAIEVRGSVSFRREVWKAAHAQGIAVAGFTSTPLEQQAADGERGRRHAENDQAAAARLTPGLGAAASVHVMPSRRPSTNPATAVVYGRLVEHGAASYQFDPKNSLSYYVKLDQGAGQVRIYWGVGLAEALRASQPAVAIGDTVGIRHAGSKPVVVTMHDFDEQGQAVVREVATQRHDWVVEKSGYVQEPGRVGQDRHAHSTRANHHQSAPGSTAEGLAASVNAVVDEQRLRKRECAAAVSSAAQTREALQRNYPELGAAVFSQLAAQQQFADEFVKAGLIREEDRQQVIQAMRERLGDQIERGEKIPLAEQKKVMTLIRQSVLRAADEVGRTPMAGASDRVANHVQTPKTLLREDVHVRA